MSKPAADPDFTTFELVPKGHRFEDFAPGQVFLHHWGRTLTDADQRLFCAATCVHVPLYWNAEYARALGHPQPPIHPLLLLCTAVGVSVEDLSEGGGPFLGVNDVTFHRPVYPGDTIAAQSSVRAKRESDSRPGFGIVTWRTEVHDQRGELVLSYERTNLVAKRSAEGSPP